MNEHDNHKPKWKTAQVQPGFLPWLLPLGGYFISHFPQLKINIISVS